MPFTGNEDHHILLSDAAELTSNYRDTKPLDNILGNYFSKRALNLILDQPSCVGMRIYYGLSKQGNPSLVIAGVNANEDDLYQGELAEFGIGCPPHCGTPNPLNS